MDPARDLSAADEALIAVPLVEFNVSQQYEEARIIPGQCNLHKYKFLLEMFQTVKKSGKDRTKVVILTIEDTQEAEDVSECIRCQDIPSWGCPFDEQNGGNDEESSYDSSQSNHGRLSEEDTA